MDEELHLIYLETNRTKIEEAVLGGSKGTKGHLQKTHEHLNMATLKVFHTFL